MLSEDSSYSLCSPKHLARRDARLLGCVCGSLAACSHFFEKKARSGTGSPKIQGPGGRCAPAVGTQPAKSTGTTAKATESAAITTMATQTTTTGAIKKTSEFLPL